MVKEGISNLIFYRPEKQKIHSNILEKYGLDVWALGTHLIRWRYWFYSYQLEIAQGGVGFHKGRMIFFLT